MSAAAQETPRADGALFHDKKGRPVEAPAPLAPLADTHGHLTCFRTLDPADAVARAALAGLRLLVVPVDPADDVPAVPAFLSWWEQTLDAAHDRLDALAAQGKTPPALAACSGAPDLLDNLHFIAGVHPYGAAALRDDPAVLARLEALLADRRCVGVGEIGLDFGPYNELGAHVQEQAFRLQLRRAHELGLPVELHIRDAGDDETAAAHRLALRVLDEEGVPEAGCDLHCFTSGPDVLAGFVELGCRVAFGGASTFGRSDDIRAAALACPEDLLLSETDSPYMAPVPLRGLECEPAMVALTVSRLADLRADRLGVPRAQTYEALWRNACALFPCHGAC